MSEYSLDVGTLNDQDRGNWNSCVSQCDHGSFFQRFEWLKAIEEGLDYEARHIIVRKGTTIVGGLPQYLAPVRGVHLNELCSIPMGYGGPLLLGDRSEVLPLILSEVRRATTGRLLLHHRISTAHLGYSQYGARLEDAGYVPDLRTCRFVLDLSESWDDLMRTLSAGRRQQVRRAENEDRFRFQDCRLKDGLDTFYPLYAGTMKRVGGLQRSRTFFEVLAELVSKKQIRVFTCKCDGETLTTFVHIVDRDRKVIHHFFSGTSEAAAGTLANQALHLHTIKWGKEQGLLSYDLGQTKAEPTDSLYVWKKAWGGQIEPCLAWHRPLSRSIAGIYEGTKRWRRRLLRWL